MASEIEVHDFGSIKGVLKSIRTLGETIRTGDIGGLPFITTAPTGDPGAAMIEVIRSPDEVLVVVINTNVKGYSNLLCHTEVTSRHWTFKTLTIDKLEVGSSSASGIGAGSRAERPPGGVHLVNHHYGTLVPSLTGVVPKLALIIILRITHFFPASTIFQGQPH